MKFQGKIFQSTDYQGGRTMNTKIITVLLCIIGVFTVLMSVSRNKPEPAPIENAGVVRKNGYDGYYVIAGEGVIKLYEGERLIFSQETDLNLYPESDVELLMGGIEVSSEEEGYELMENFTS